MQNSRRERDTSIYLLFTPLLSYNEDLMLLARGQKRLNKEMSLESTGELGITHYHAFMMRYFPVFL